MVIRFLSFTLFLFFLSITSFAQSIQLADSLRVKGEQLQEQGNFKEAEFYYKEAYSLYRQHQDTASWLETGVFYAEVLYYRSKYNQAIDLFEQLKDVNHPAKNLNMKARIESDLGLANKEVGNWEQTVEHYETALSLAKQAGDSLLIGTTLHHLASNYRSKGDYANSLELYKETVSYFKGINNQRGLFYAFNSIGSIYRDLYLYDKALDYYTRSLEISKKLNNVNILASIYERMGRLQKEMGNYDQALIAYQKSLTYRDQAGSPERKAQTLNNIGVLYSELGNLTRALDYYEESLKIRKEISHPVQLTTLYSNIANRLWDAGKQQEAMEYYQQALNLKREVGNPSAIVTSLLDLTKVEVSKNVSDALEYARRARAIADSLNDYSLLKDADKWLGMIHNQLGNTSVALSHYNNSLAYSRYLGSASQINPLISLARFHHMRGSDSALVYGREAISLIEQGRSKVGSYSGMKANYFKQYIDFYIDMASWALNYNDDIAEAYSLIEQAKARTLADELVQASQRVDENLPEEVRIERNKMLTSIDGLYSKLQVTENESIRKDLDSEIREMELKYAAFQNELHEKYPQYKKLELQEPITLDEAQEINEPETAIIEYAVTDDRLLAFFISSEQSLVKQYSLDELKSTQDIELKQLVQRFKDAILAHAGRSELDLLSDKLYDILLKPFENQLADYSNLIIVPDGALAYLPFEAIRNNESYLIEQFNIKYIPSITSLTLLKKPEKEQEKQLLAVAGSEVMNVNSETGRRINTLSALPSTLIEVDSIAAHFSTVTTLKEDDVTERALKQHLNSKYKYIHLAAHGFIDEDQPNQSGLRLSGTSGMDASSEDDGLLKSSEIYRLNLSSDMVVLSACNTGLGKVVKGEGMLGLQRSFFYAGTSSVVVSLWNVYDRSTAHLMNEFYKSILNKEHTSEESWVSQFSRWVGWDESIPFGEKAAAMRTAKLRLIDHPLFNHPVYWAPFIVVGR